MALATLLCCCLIDAFEQLADEEGTKQSLVHIRIQQRTGRKAITTVQGIAPEYDLKKIVRYLKKVCFLLRLSESLRSQVKHFEFDLVLSVVYLSFLWQLGSFFS